MRIQRFNSRPLYIKVAVTAPGNRQQTAVFQFTLTCSRGPIFVCFVCVTDSSVAAKDGHLQSRVQQVFSTFSSLNPSSSHARNRTNHGLSEPRRAEPKDIQYGLTS